MLYQPDLMIYLWMMPAFSLVVVPLLWSLWCSLYRSVERSKLAEVRGFVEAVSPEAARENIADRRRIPRVRIKGGNACVTEEVNCCRAFVENVSADGICLSNLPHKMYMEAETFRVVLKTRQRDYGMFVRPMWKKEGGSGYAVGGEIIRVPVGWRDFVNSLGGPALAEAA